MSSDEDSLFDDELLDFFRGFSPKTVQEIPADARRIVYVSPDGQVPGGFVPSIVFENVSGHFPLSGRGAHASPWVWGPTWGDAQRQVAEANRRLGIDEREALEILLSSMRQQRVEDGDIHG